MQATIAELFPRVRKLQYELQSSVNFVEAGRANSDDAYVSLSELRKQIEILDKIVIQEPPKQRDTWRKKINELQKEADFIKMSLDKYVNSQRKSLKDQLERDELLKRRTEALPSNVMDHYIEEGNSIHRSKAMVNDIINTSRNVLSDLMDQRTLLKSAHRRALDIANLLGLSNTIMRIAERRNRVDRLIVFGGMVVVTVFLYLCYAYTKGYFTSTTEPPPILDETLHITEVNIS